MNIPHDLLLLRGRKRLEYSHGFFGAAQRGNGKTLWITPVFGVTPPFRCGRRGFFAALGGPREGRGGKGVIRVSMGRAESANATNPTAATRVSKTNRGFVWAKKNRGPSALPFTDHDGDGPRARALVARGVSFRKPPRGTAQPPPGGFPPPHMAPRRAGWHRWRPFRRAFVGLSSASFSQDSITQFQNVASVA
eukprot:gene2125-biopygen19941